MKYTYMVSALLCLTLIACHHQQQSESSNPDAWMECLRIDTVQSSSFFTTYSTVGTVRAEAGKIAKVGLPLDGRIGASFVHLNQHVTKGTPLFSVYSPEFAENCKSYFQAESNYQLLNHAYARQQILCDSGIVSQRELEEKSNELELARRELSQWKNTMKALGIDMTSLNTSGEMNISAPISGDIVHMELTSGQYVRQDDPALITIADLNTIWVSAQVKEYYLSMIHADDSVEIHLNDSRHFHRTGHILYIGQMLDPETRSVEVLISCANTGHDFKPGMFAHVDFTVLHKDAIQIASSAVLQGEENPYVYVLREDNSFERRPVQVSGGEEGLVMVTHGLEPGERIVGEGGIYIQ